MERVEVLLAAVTPGILVLAYGVTKTRGSWSSEALWTAFLLGGLGVVVAIPIELLIRWLIGLAALSPLLGAGALAVLVAAIPEETTKFLILIGAAETHVDARRRQDIIVLATAVSLGFATVENFLYLLAPEHWGLTVTGRALTAVPGHGINGLTMGALLTAARVRPDRRIMWTASALVIPAIMHAAYDFPLFAITSHAAQPATLPWIALLWCVIFLISSIVAIGLCNWILPAAKQADSISRHNSRGLAPAGPLIIVGVILFVSASTLAFLIYWVRGHSGLAASAVLGVVPIVLALDLIWTGLRRRADNKRVRASIQEMKRSIIG